MRSWWHGLMARERRMLIGGAVALVAILFYFLLWLPPHQRADELRRLIERQQADLAYLRQAAVEVRALRSEPSRVKPFDALYALADRTARDAGLAGAIRRIAPTGDDRVQVELQGAAFDGIVRWLARLQREYGVMAELVQLRRADAPGTVAAQLVLEAVGQ